MHVRYVEYGFYIIISVCVFMCVCVCDRKSVV